MVVWFATPIAEVAVGVEPCRARAAEPREERLAVAAAADVVGHEVGLGEVEDDEVPPARVQQHPRDGGPRLLVGPLAVDERREALAGVLLDALPDVEHRPAGRVHEHRAAAGQALEVARGDAERRQHHDVAGGHVVERPHVGVADEADALVAQARVHARVVDDLARQDHAAVGELRGSGGRSPRPGPRQQKLNRREANVRSATWSVKPSSRKRRTIAEW
jgi:hypothetical protein